jgi:hypothetical protein
MRNVQFSLKLASLSIALATFIGCESTDNGGNVSGGAYYGVGFYDPWYYGSYDDDADIIVTPPPSRPEAPPRPTQPIARPNPGPRPMPSIPSAPRVATRR